MLKRLSDIIRDLAMQESPSLLKSADVVFASEEKPTTVTNPTAWTDLCELSWYSVGIPVPVSVPVSISVAIPTHFSADTWKAFLADEHAIRKYLDPVLYGKHLSPCSTCGQRFEPGSNESKIHMDWHFQNSGVAKGKRMETKRKQQSYFIAVSDWLLTSPAEQAHKEEQLRTKQRVEEDKLKEQNRLKLLLFAVASEENDSKLSCGLCGEKLSQSVWNDDVEEFVYQGVVDIPSLSMPAGNSERDQTLRRAWSELHEVVNGAQFMSTLAEQHCHVVCLETHVLKRAFFAS
jgi:hypothetical protein